VEIWAVLGGDFGEKWAASHGGVRHLVVKYVSPEDMQLYPQNPLKEDLGMLEVP
jgi:hypothetical protein